MDLKLDSIRAGTIFKYNSITYKKGFTYEANKVLCTPKYGGQWQDAVETWIEVSAIVYVKPD